MAAAAGLPVPWLAEVPGRLLELVSEAALQPGLSYERFLHAYAPDRRREQGVFSTPEPLVRAQVRLVADLLERAFGCRLGLGDARLGLVDPATGDGAYLLAAVDDARQRGAGVAAMAGRRVGFEPQVGAAVLARARLAAALGCPDAPIRVADALASTWQPAAPIAVCIGNPPYRRGRARGGHQLAEFAGAGIHAKNLHNAYVEFWRWALRAVLEQRAGPGIVSLVTPASFLNGPGFAGMRAVLRRAFDEVWVLDLEGDQRGARPTDNVFGIRTPVAVAMGVRYGPSRPAVPARAWYARLGGSRAQKLAVLGGLHRLDDVTWSAVTALSEPGQTFSAGWSAPLVARPRTRYHRWPLLTELFPVQLAGCQMKRTWPIGPSPELLQRRWAHLLELPAQARRAAFRPTRDRDLDARPPDLMAPDVHLVPLAELPAGAAGREPVPYAYRSFDRQWVIPDARLGDFMRPRLWRMAGPRQLFLTSLLTAVLGAGPAVVATALVPDLDHFRGSFGARAVIPLWLDARATQPNVAPGWLAALQQRLGVAVGAEELLAMVYALLGSPAYTRRFSTELREPGPRVPLPGDAHQFRQAVALGRRLLCLHTFGARCTDQHTRRPCSARCLREPSATPERISYAPVDQVLQVGDGSFGPVDPHVWGFSVSGLHVVQSWLRYRVGGPKRVSSELDRLRPVWTASTSHELLELLWMLEATLALQPALDALLDDVLAGGG